MEKRKHSKALFIDRDGTILVEPDDEQIDSIEKTRFVDGALTALSRIAQYDFDLVLATNQDGLGTEAFPMETFLPSHNIMLSTLESVGVRFADELIDRSFPADGKPTRKPGTGMFGKYTDGSCNLAESYVIGDRATDVLLARNLGCRAILLQEPEAGKKMLSEAGVDCMPELITNSWAEIADHLRRRERVATIDRQTRETQIKITVDLDGRLPSAISTGLHFYDHMLSQIVHHAGISLQIDAHGDLEVDEHHTMEDVAICLGQALYKALGDKRGIGRYGFALPMDDCDALVLLDLGGRIDFSWKVPFTREYVGDTPTEMFSHVFQSLACALQCNLHIEARGDNNHHLSEAVFKAFARALRSAVRQEPFCYDLPSSKGLL